MKNITLLIASAATLTAGCSQTPPVKVPSPAQETVNALANAVSGQQIERLEIIQMNPWVMTRSRITPQALEKHYDYKLIIQRLSGFGGREKMTKALSSVAVKPLEEGADLCWGVIFYGQNDVRVGAVYFDRSGSRGSVNDMPVSFEGEFLLLVGQDLFRLLQVGFFYF
jgi:hypothetical protein